MLKLNLTTTFKGDLLLAGVEPKTISPNAAQHTFKPETEILISRLLNEETGKHSFYDDLFDYDYYAF